MDKCKRKINDLYFMSQTGNDFIISRKFKNKKYSYIIERKKSKIKYILKNSGTSYEESYTIGNKRILVSSIFHSTMTDHGFVTISMTKGATKKEGIITIKVGMNNIINFKFNSEPCILRLLSNTFTFTEMLNSDLGTYMQVIRDTIRTGMEDIRKINIMSTSMQAILEYYTKNE